MTELPQISQKLVIEVDFDTNDPILAGQADGKLPIIPRGHPFHHHASYKASLKKPLSIERFVRADAGHEWVYKMEFNSRDHFDDQWALNSLECSLVKCSEPLLVVRKADGSSGTLRVCKAVEQNMLPRAWNWINGGFPDPPIRGYAGYVGPTSRDTRARGPPLQVLRLLVQTTNLCHLEANVGSHPPCSLKSVENVLKISRISFTIRKTRVKLITIDAMRMRGQGVEAVPHMMWQRLGTDR